LFVLRDIFEEMCGQKRRVFAIFYQFGGWRAEMQGDEREKLRRELDEALLPFRLARRRRGFKEGWLRSIRQAVGVPVDEVARRLGVCRWEVYRLEESEKNSRIMLATLSRAAKGLGCELVYALAPKEGTLEEMAAEQSGVREELRLRRERERVAKKKPWLEAIGWREVFLGALRTALRREGFRVRPRKTERGVEKQQAAFKETMKLAGVAGVMGPVVGELASQQVSKLASQQVSKLAGQRVSKSAGQRVSKSAGQRVGKSAGEREEE
jgi:transcriptional regulator with XRE-family HTH domain